MNTTKILYQNEINPQNRLSNQREVSLVQNSDFFQRYINFRSIDYRVEVKKRIDQNLIKHQVNQSDITKLRSIVNPRGYRGGLSSEDLSLIILALKKSKNMCHPSIIITEDTKLRTSIKEKIHKHVNFISSDGSILETKNLISIGFINYLLRIYNDCKFDYIDDIVKYYDKCQAKLIRNLLNLDTLKGKLRLSNSSAADIASIMRIKLEKRSQIHA